MKKKAIYLTIEVINELNKRKGKNETYDCIVRKVLDLDALIIKRGPDYGPLWKKLAALNIGDSCVIPWDYDAQGVFVEGQSRIFAVIRRFMDKTGRMLIQMPSQQDGQRLYRQS